ncbi:flagellar hook-associated protein FlgK [Thalassotalea euphylliae]|uniref:Flagellar hook-associated protein 1 n=1 Tax=Thalassotalea euphylliae TaxID=1655234 RepID=A0A3E0U0N2_9GAMM|nr:flagellar hook-associated protein FlgK [Thalassotalea euphylliae]REL30294.1 flagellar hook-associated protein FlgK [Thalassotalea euphylliae]
MTVNLYQTGVSGLLSAQQQLATTGHNIANVNTDGYSRQRAEQSPTQALQSGGNFIGTGTYVADISRLYDQFAYREQVINQSNLGAANASNASLTQLNGILGSAGGAITSSIEQFYQSINSIADNPSDPALRSIALNQAKTLTTNFNNLNDSFDRIETATNGEIEEIAKQISEISTELANINEQILHTNSPGQPGQPNDLLDERDRLINQLAEFTSVNTVTDANGVMTVMIGSGNTLVAGTTPLSLQVVPGDPDPLQTQVAIASKNTTIPLKQDSLGGSLGAKIKFRDEDLAQARSEINRVALVLSETLNGAQRQGLDLNQGQGANFFRDINDTTNQSSRILPYSGNSAPGLQAGIEITNVSQLPTNDFDLSFDGANYQLTNLADGTTTNLGAPGSGTYTTSFGFNFVENSGTPAAGDRFTIRPTENSAALMQVELTDGKAIAASSAVSVTASSNNVSAGEVEIVAVSDPVAARAAAPLRVNVLESPAGSGTFNYTITNLTTNTTSAPAAYTPPSQQIQLPAAPATAAFTIEISGRPSGQAPNGPEQFTISDAFGTGNGENAKFIADTREQGIINGGRESFSQSIGITTAQVGSQAKAAELGAETSQALFTQAFNRNQETSGVNLDEEAANLLRFQQAYQASSRVVSVANTIFDTLLSAVG